MKRIPFLVLILTLGWLSPPMQKMARAAEVEITQPPNPIDDDVIVLGSVSLPREVANKLDPKQLAHILEQQATTPKSTAELIFDDHIIVPGIVFASMAFVSFMLIYYSFRKRREMLDTIRVAIQSGQTLPTSFLEALQSSRPKPTPDGDLRKAVLLIALGISGSVVLATLGDKEMGRAWSIGLLPTLLGVGYLFLWRQSQKHVKTGSPDDQR